MERIAMNPNETILSLIIIVLIGIIIHLFWTITDKS